MLAAGDASDRVDDETQNSPEKSRYHGEWATKSLDREPSRIGIRDIVRTGNESSKK